MMDNRKHYSSSTPHWSGKHAGTNPLLSVFPLMKSFPLFGLRYWYPSVAKLKYITGKAKNTRDGLSTKMGKLDRRPNMVDLVKGKAALLPWEDWERQGGYKGYGYACVNIVAALQQGLS